MVRLTPQQVAREGKGMGLLLERKDSEDVEEVRGGTGQWR